MFNLILNSTKTIHLASLLKSRFSPGNGLQVPSPVVWKDTRTPFIAPHCGHQVHVFTSPHLDGTVSTIADQEVIQPRGSPNLFPMIHYHEGEPGRWRYNKAWEQFQEENQHEPFDVVHSESVALPHYLARNLSNLAVSWHGIALETMQSSIYQDLAFRNNEPMSPDINKRVHVIANGVDEDEFKEDWELGQEFRSKIGVPSNVSVLLGVARRLVNDKGHPLLYEAFSKLKGKHRDVYLVVAGSGPWQQRYKDLEPQVIVLGSMNPSELVSQTLRPQGLDLTLMEAMMSGTPIMASRFPSIKGTIVVDDEFGYMFSPNVESLVEAMELVVASKRLLQRGKLCREHAASMFTARKMSLAYDNLFHCIKNQTFCNYP